MRCPECSHPLVKGDLALGAYECSMCKARWFLIKTKPAQKSIKNLVVEIWDTIESYPSLHLAFKKVWFNDSR